MDGFYLRFDVGTVGEAGTHVRYITRLTATSGDENSLYLHNYPEVVRGADYKDLRVRLVAFNQGAEKNERTVKRRGPGKTRTFYKLNLSLKGKVETEVAREMAIKYLEQKFPKGVALASVHQDTEHTHVHVNLLARQTDGRKVQLRNGDYKKLDEGWAAVYGERFGKEKETEHLRKKEETREWKKDYARGVRGVEKPGRVDRGLRKDEFKRREVRNYDQGRDRGNQRGLAGGERTAASPVGGVERSFAARDGGEANVARTSEKIREASGLAQRLGEEIERRSREDRGVERGR